MIVQLTATDSTEALNSMWMIRNMAGYQAHQGYILAAPGHPYFFYIGRYGPSFKYCMTSEGPPCTISCGISVSGQFSILII